MPDPGRPDKGSGLQSILLRGESLREENKQAKGTQNPSSWLIAGLLHQLLPSSNNMHEKSPLSLEQQSLEPVSRSDCSSVLYTLVSNCPCPDMLPATNAPAGNKERDSKQKHPSDPVTEKKTQAVSGHLMCAHIPRHSVCPLLLREMLNGQHSLEKL